MPTFFWRIFQKIISLICFWNIELNRYLLLIVGISRKKGWDVEHNFPVQKVEKIGYKIGFAKQSHLSGKTRIFADQISARFLTTWSSEVTPTKALNFWKRFRNYHFLDYRDFSWASISISKRATVRRQQCDASKISCEKGWQMDCWSNVSAC